MRLTDADLDRMRSAAEYAALHGESPTVDIGVLLALLDLAARSADMEARIEKAFAGIRCAHVHWQPEGVSGGVSCVNCQSWAKTIAMPLFTSRALLDAQTEGERDHETD